MNARERKRTARDCKRLQKTGGDWLKTQTDCKGLQPSTVKNPTPIQHTPWIAQPILPHVVQSGFDSVQDWAYSHANGLERNECQATKPNIRTRPSQDDTSNVSTYLEMLNLTTRLQSVCECASQIHWLEYEISIFSRVSSSSHFGPSINA